MVEDGVDLVDEGEFVGLLFFWGSEYLSAGDDFVEEGVNRDFLIDGLGGVVEFNAGCPGALVDVDWACGHVDSLSLSLCVLEESADGFFGSRADGVNEVVLTDVIVLSDHVDGAGSESLDNTRDSDSLIDASSVFFKLLVSEVFCGDEEAKCLRDDVVGVNVAVDVFGGEFIRGETGGGHAGCVRECSSCCC